MSMISIQNLIFGYDGSYDNVFENVSFQIDTDWKFGFTGRNGRGKTTFLKLLMGKYEHRGTVSSNMDFEYFPFNVNDKTQFAIDIIKEKAYLEDYDYWKVHKELSFLNIDEEILHRPFNSLSGGEQAKILLASLFLKENYFLLIDKTTNHLYIKAREIVSNYVKNKKGFIIVLHDRNFLDNCIGHILSINKTNIEIQKGTFHLGMKISKSKITLK